MDYIAAFMNSIYLPIVLIIAVLCYGVYLIVTKNVNSVVRNSKDKTFKNPDKCAMNAGYLMFLLAGECILMMAIEVFLGSLAATIAFLVMFFVFGFLWRKNIRDNGPM